MFGVTVTHRTCEPERASWRPVRRCQRWWRWSAARLICNAKLKRGNRAQLSKYQFTPTQERAHTHTQAITQLH